MQNIVETAASTDRLKTMLAAICASDLVEELSGPGPYTVFAPSEEAFDKVPRYALEAIFKPQAKLQLLDTIQHHVVRGRIYSEDMRRLRQAKTLQGQSVHLDNAQGFRVDGAHVVIADVICDNGVIHVIDTVIPPQ